MELKNCFDMEHYQYVFGGDQSVIRGIMRALYLYYRGYPVLYFIQNMDKLGDKHKRLELKGARKKFFPFSWDMYGHPEYPGSFPGSEKERLKIRKELGPPRLILGTRKSVLQKDAFEYNKVKELIIQAFIREIDWCANLVPESEEAQIRARDLKNFLIISDYSNFDSLLIDLVRYILGPLWPDSPLFNFTTLFDYFRQNPFTDKEKEFLHEEEIWVVNGDRKKLAEASLLEKERGVWVPVGSPQKKDGESPLLKIFRHRGGYLFAGNLPYDNNYIKVILEGHIPKGANPQWRFRPTLISQYVLGGRELLNDIIKGKEV